ncbi:zinc transporter, ZIP family [Candidatus Nanopelagicus limnes]|jgi:ZIP family zinc transporter|uniref:Zinc transporter, ZIP family n=1 Tax=Candidatus Nanopelagicus limnae TaxID=1884634 RepID=A0A249JX31_9ACTN|nr:ZIP family metal transporter [Candidatus Nanopelagicus limnes]ASY09088.1 zinc transporter, ZIP family [Candidatus Nanopelagicus limnes]
MLVIGLAAITVIATFMGGLLALRAKDRFHLVLGLSAGLLLGLVGFDLLPEIFEMNSSNLGGVKTISIALISGFLFLHFLEQFVGSHEPAESDYGHDHKHAVEIAGVVGAVAMAGHIFLDGVALALAFKVSTELGIAVFIAMIVHAFSDGLNTVALLIKTNQWREKGKYLLGLDAVARIGGAALGSSLTISDANLAIYLAAFSGIVIYLATSHILPEAHSKHPSRVTMVATLAGVVIMWLLVANL